MTVSRNALVRRSSRSARSRSVTSSWVETQPPPSTGENCAVGRVENIAYLGDLSVYKVRLNTGLVLKATVANVTRLVERSIDWDDRVWLTWAPDAAMVLTR